MKRVPAEPVSSPVPVPVLRFVVFPAVAAVVPAC